MLQQVLVIAANGICLVDRQYEKLLVDPQLLAGFLSAVVPKMEDFGYNLSSLHAELIGDKDTYLEVYYENNFLCAGIATRNVSNNKVRSILEAINALTVGQLGMYDDMHYSTVPTEIYTIIEDQIDIMVTKKGISAISSRDASGLLPIITQVQNGKMKPKRAAKMILDWIQSGDLDEEDITNMKHSLNFIDQLLTKTNNGKLDELQITIRTTVQGVSRLTVKLDDALSF